MPEHDHDEHAALRHNRLLAFRVAIVTGSLAIVDRSSFSLLEDHETWQRAPLAWPVPFVHVCLALKAHCEPFDMPKTNQRVYALTL